MALLRKWFFRKPPDGLLEISERIYVLECCFSVDPWTRENYKTYLQEIVGQLRDYLPDASVLVFNFREENEPSQMGDILSEFNMTTMDYPRHYGGCSVLTIEVIHHFLRSCESWFSLGPQNVLLMHFEHGAWPVLAFILAAFLIYRNQYSGEQKTLDMVYKQAPRDLLQFESSINPVPSQLRYLHYVLQRNVSLEWPPSDRALILDCIILRLIPDFGLENGCRPLFHIYGRNPFHVSDRTPKVMYSTQKKGKTARAYKQGECELAKIDINCHILGDVVIECFSLNDDMEHKELMFRVALNTSFIRSNLLILNSDEIDMLWNVKDRFPEGFRVEILFCEGDAVPPIISGDVLCFEEEGLPVEAFAKVQEIFNHIDWLDPKKDVALTVLQQMTTLNIACKNLDFDSRQNLQSSPVLGGNDSGKLQEKSLPGLENENVTPKGILVVTPEALQNEKDPKLQDNQIPRNVEVSSLTNELLGSPGSTLDVSQEPVNLGAESVLTEPMSPSPTPPCSPVISSAVNSVPTPPPPPPLPSQSRTHNFSVLKLDQSMIIKEAETYLGDNEGRLLTVIPPLGSQTSSSTTIQSALSYNFRSSSASESSSLNKASCPSPPTPPPPTPPLKQNMVLRVSPFTPVTSPSLLTTKEVHSISSLAPLPPPPPEPPLLVPSLASTQSIPPPPLPPPPPPPLKQNMVSRVSPLTPSPSSHSLTPGASPFVSSPVALPPPPPPPPLPPPPPISVPSSPALGATISTRTSTTPPPPPPPPPPCSILKSTSSPFPLVPAPPPAPFAKRVPKAGEAFPANSTFRSTANTKGRSLSRTISPKIITKKMKPLHWLKITRAAQGSLWAETQKTGELNMAPKIDMSELENLFSVAVSASDPGKKSRGRGLSRTKSEKVQLIDHRRAYNCEIMLSKVKVPLHYVLSSVLALEDSLVLDVDLVENLVKFCPTKEEMELLKGYTGEKKKLGKCEQFFLELMQVPRIQSKLRVFLFKIQFNTQVFDLVNSLNTVNSVAEEASNTKWFQMNIDSDLQTILSLGNALNQGTARGSAIGFRLDSLLKLTETCSQSNNMTLMHYLCKIIAEKLPEILDFSKDLSSLEPASKIELKILAEETQAVSKGIEKVVQELSTSENDGPVLDEFRQKLKKFLDFAEAEVRSLASLYSAVGRNVDSLIIYFGEDPARCPFEQVVATLHNFSRAFNRAHEENRKKLERDGGLTERRGDKMKQ